MERIALALGLLFAAAPAPPAIRVIHGEAAVARRDGPWSAVAKGSAPLAPDAFLLIPDPLDSVTLGIGGERIELTGFLVLPVQALASREETDKYRRFFRALTASEALLYSWDPLHVERSRGTLPEAGEKRVDSFVGKDTVPRSTAADFAEGSLRRGDSYLAGERCRAILADSKASAFEKYRASFVNAHVLYRSDVSKAIDTLDVVIGPPPAGMTAEEARALPGYRSGALVLRGIMRYGHGDRAAAAKDLTAATKESAGEDRLVGSELARLLLAAIALDDGDRAAAETHVASLAKSNPRQGSLRIGEAAKDLLAGP